LTRSDAVLLGIGTVLLLVIGFILVAGPQEAAAFAIPISILALIVSVVGAFRGELFPFDLHVVAGDVLLLPGRFELGYNPPLMIPLAFVNRGYGEGVVASLWAEVTCGDGLARLYTPSFELDYRKYLQEHRGVHASNIIGTFMPFVVGAKEAEQRFFVFSQERTQDRYPETAWVPGDFEVSVYMRTTSDSNRKMLARFSHEIGAEALENAARGTAIYLTPKFTPSPA
jgi:hypothetical protein